MSKNIVALLMYHVYLPYRLGLPNERVVPTSAYLTTILTFFSTRLGGLALRSETPSQCSPD